MALYAVLFIPLGIPAALGALVFARRMRALGLLVLAGSAAFVSILWSNLLLTWSFRAPESLAIDAVLLATIFLLAWRRYRASDDDRLRLGRWVGTGTAAGALCLAIFPLDIRWEGSEPAVTKRGDVAPNVLLYVIDTLRADHLGTYGYTKLTSPEIDAFAEDAVAFEECIAPCSWTMPSMASLFTSRYPSAHTVDWYDHNLSADAVTLAEVFKAAGWRTAGFTANPMLSSEGGYGQGFETFVQASTHRVNLSGTTLWLALSKLGLANTVMGWDPLDRAYVPARRIHEDEGGVLDFVDEAGDTPWFMWVQAMEPHEPYQPPRELAERFGLPPGTPYVQIPHTGARRDASEPTEEFMTALQAQYDGEIRSISETFGNLLAQLDERGALENTIVVLASDHGEEFHERGGWSHGFTLQHEVVWVPLIVRFPDTIASPATRGRRIRTPCSLLDVFPTLTEACGIEFPGFSAHGKMGSSLARWILGSDEEPANADRELIGELSSEHRREFRSIRTGRWFYQHVDWAEGSAEVLYDVVADPGETDDQAATEAEHTRALASRLELVLQLIKETALSAEIKELDPAAREQLRGLGYILGDE